MSATGYLPRRWPAKYCHCYESLRPCSGWERVVSSRLVTDEFCFHSPLHAYAFLHHSLVSLSLNYFWRFRCICRLRFWLRLTYSKYRMCIQSCIMIINFAIILTLFGSACAIFDCFVSSAFASLTTAVFLNIRYATCSSCSASRLRCFALLIYLLGKALVRLVSVGWKCCHSYTSDLSTW